MKYVTPSIFAESFTCPYCDVFAHQVWNAASLSFQTTDREIRYIKSRREKGTLGYSTDLTMPVKLPLRSARCQHCMDYSIWRGEKMIFPNQGSAPPPNAEMSESVKKLYLEAASISAKSPRGAAALLRLSIQILCKELDEPGKNINADIKSLVEKGLPVGIQQALDIVRVVGNDAVHPGQIDTDDIEVVGALFGLINMIVEDRIERPKKLEALYQTLPESKRDGIANRDKTD